MPRIETYQPNRVRRGPVAGVMRRAPGPEAFGATFGADLAQVGGAVLQEAERIKAEEDQRADQLALVTAEKQYNQLATVFLHSTDKGILQKTGRQPMELREEYQKAFDAQAEEIQKGATNDRQRIAFARMGNDRRASFMNQLDSHATTQFRVYEKGEYDAALTSSLNTSVAAAGGATALDDQGVPAFVSTVKDQLALQESIVRAGGERLYGGAAAQQGLIEKLRSDTHVGVVNQLLASNKERQAEEYFAEVKDQITDPNQRARIQERIERDSKENQAFERANAIWESSVPANSDEQFVPPMQEMEAKLREQYRGDAKGYAQAVSFLRDRKGSLDAARRDAENKRDSDIWGAVAEGATLSQVRTLPAYRLADGKTQQVVEKYFVDEAERRESRAAAAESRAAARENRELAAITRKERELEQQGWSRYYELSQPDRLRGMTRGAILREIPTLGIDHVNRLLKDQEDLQKSDAVVRTATIDRETFQDIAFNAGLDYAYSTPAQQTEEQKARLGRLRAQTEAAIAADQAEKRRALSQEEKQAVMRDIVGRRVMLDRWTFDKEMIAATVQENEFGNAYVPVDQIPAARLQVMLNYIKGMPRRAGTFETRPPSDAEIKAAYKDKLQRAYARVLLTGDDKQAWDILEAKD